MIAGSSSDEATSDNDHVSTKQFGIRVTFRVLRHILNAEMIDGPLTLSGQFEPAQAFFPMQALTLLDDRSQASSAPFP